MRQLDEWGDAISDDNNDDDDDGVRDSIRNLYEEDWNWNPIDEAPVHRGRTDFWDSNFEGVDAIYFAPDEDDGWDRR